MPKVKSVSYEHYEGNVYNFHCEPNENYIADGILVHNCYKANTPEGHNMSLDTFKNVFKNLNQHNTLTQIAFGADSQATNNPDLFPMMEYCRENGVIPNITVAQISDETAVKLANVCGAVAVSRYSYKDACYDSVDKLTDSVLDQKIMVRK